ncbi:PH domain-containing protein [Streptomyces sp. 549]|uniref:PH domain-containing protein n=1 Tax=Streptomyces sp. 549 TaxID=3049076 RepID=UPI0024C46E79|nr:PH domain-containing protein [Streptomyces sp. 549]MDK1472322.1 PH domain-containing protein [Streptomyces sp. 549]
MQHQAGSEAQENGPATGAGAAPTAGSAAPPDRPAPPDHAHVPDPAPGSEPVPAPEEAPVTEAAPAPAGHDAPAGEWRGVERALLRMRRVVLLGTTLLFAGVPTAVLLLVLGPPWGLLPLLWLVPATWGWFALARNWRSWRYSERADDLLISRGVLWRELTVVPYGRMQLVEVTSGPLERRYGLARLQLHTAAAATDAAIPGLVPAEAERLRDRLTELGEARSAGL